MALIRITPETLEGQAKDLLSKKDQHEDIYNQIKQLVTSLAEEWQGETQKAFHDSFTQKDVVFKQFSEEMIKFAQFMNQAATRMRAAEEELKSGAQQLA
jgi:WXG100 family type VII secretion target